MYKENFNLILWVLLYFANVLGLFIQKPCLSLPNLFLTSSSFHHYAVILFGEITPYHSLYNIHITLL